MSSTRTSSGNNAQTPSIKVGSWTDSNSITYEIWARSCFRYSEDEGRQGWVEFYWRSQENELRRLLKEHEREVVWDSHNGTTEEGIEAIYRKGWTSI